MQTFKRKSLHAALLAGLAAVAFIGTADAQITNYPKSAHPVTALEEQRYCGAPPRTASGGILRRADVLAAFKKAHPCPVNGATSGACPGWVMDHIIPLACGGCDAVSNLQWLTTDAWKIKTGFERDPGVYSPVRCAAAP
jgi:hypothetical protein